ncbi:hypothetical protein BDW69DRAFT_193034 [Aspergillus filifer]
MIPPSASSSNWDFTPVINLLRLPTSQGQDQSTSISPPAYPDPQDASHSITKNDVKESTIKEQSLKDGHVSSPKLGDFSALWELLGNVSSTRAVSKNSKRDNDIQESLQQPQSPNKPVKIRKRRVSNKQPVSTLTASTPTSIQAVVDNHSTSHDKAYVEPRVPAQRHHRRLKSNHDTSVSESNAEGESDASLFDPPLLKPRSVYSMIPPQVGAPETPAKPIGTYDTPPSSFEEVDEFLTARALEYPPSAGAPRLQPIAYRTAADQRVGLLTKLMKDFPDYTELLIEAGHLKKSKKLDVSSRPIHVFVDMSNIMVGFHDTMKISRNIPIQTRIRRLPMSYQNFSLILERGRQTAKRVLVGSDRIAAINESEQLGYEANILNRVQKTKQLTARQLKFRKYPNVISQDGGHGSETNDGTEGKWVEQGVDEILHLKILESLLDTDEPETIVLATGDAAEAEYSGGFMKMVERALQRGWRVELVSFSQVTSYAYKKKEFRSRWGTQFQMIPLDDYRESQDLYGGAIKATIPEGWLDASDLRQIPDHQELFLSPTTLSNLIFEINERVSEETALSALQSAPNKEVLETLGPNPGATPETVDKAAALYHLNDICDDDNDTLRIVAPPQQVSLQKLPKARSYKGVAQMTSLTTRPGIAPSVGGAPAGSSTDGGFSASVTLHYLLVRLEEQETDVLVFFNTPHKEFDERGDPRGLAKEEELANSVIDALIEKLEIADWGLFGG